MRDGGSLCRRGRGGTQRWRALVFAVLMQVGAAFGQAWVPQRSVEVVVPMAAGGSIDILARAMQRTWTEQRLLPVASIMANKGGAGQALAYHYVSQHPGNPYVIGIMSSNLLTSYIAGRVQHSHADFAPIALLVTGSYFALAVNADSPFRNARELVDALRRNPGAVAVGLGSAAGAAHHIALGLALQSAGVDLPRLRIVSFGDSAQLAAALLGGHVEVGMATLINVAPHVESGKLRALSVSAPARVRGAMGTVPTWPELGYKGVWEGWRGLYGAKGITPGQVAYWEALARRTTQDPEFRRFVEGSDMEVRFRGAADVSKWLDEQYGDLKTVMNQLGYARAQTQ